MINWSMCDDSLLRLVANVICDLETQEDLFSPWSGQSEGSQVSWWSSSMMLTRNVRDLGSNPCWGTELFFESLIVTNSTHCYHWRIQGGGAPGTRAPPPGGPNSFIFMQFSAKMWKIIAILGVGAPPWGKSWIRHWLHMHCEPLNSNDPWEIESILTLVDLLLYCTCIYNNVFCISGYVANDNLIPTTRSFS